MEWEGELEGRERELEEGKESWRGEGEFDGSKAAALKGTISCRTWGHFSSICAYKHQSPSPASLWFLASNYYPQVSRGWRLDAGGRRLKAGGWRLEAGDLWLETRGSRPEAGDPRPEANNWRPEARGWQERGDVRTYGQKMPPMFYRTLSHSGLLPKRSGKESCRGKKSLRGEGELQGNPECHHNISE